MVRWLVVLRTRSLNTCLRQPALREAVHGVRVDVKLPVDVRARHLLLEGIPMLARDEGVRRAGADEDGRLDPSGSGCPGGEAAVEAHDGAQVGSAPRKLESRKPAEAV